ncbi:zn 2cys6 transcription factor [Colletotrichum truncatum]|uniref:Zn 2cys6 transcription factor n=1 Tax=Colletotrichum truncatum TaxID=5467 RepID=A0ACC3Z0M9_COLTU|nr:zn 2cys6 transcription factor [Colletotrichum truncatum]KAF6800592.1 zn 2cys6 transcription factor [Colletotrichum truncatum]
MDTQIDADGANNSATPRQRVTNACEACRAAKVKCQASVQLGICRRCLDFKRECVFRTGPRTRRPRQSKLNQDAPPPPPPPGPSKTFSIDFDMPQLDDGDDVESLAARHERYLKELLPPDSGLDDIDMMFAFGDSSSASHSNISSPPSSGPSVSVSSFSMKPQFNLDSAEKLLQTFRGMLKSFPCIALPPDATVMSLSKTKPFLLLAILSTASGSSALQGHTLYDEEFRKVLGLKFVAGCERTLELLQGLLIYTAWYPFHLRPKSKQAFQYVRMASEIIQDLDLTEPFPGVTAGSVLTPEQMDGIRAYLSCYYMTSAHVLPFLQYFRKTSLTDARFAIGWAKMAVLEYTSWTSTCCDLLERCSALRGDHTLAWLVRLQHVTEEASELAKVKLTSEQTKQHVHFMSLGLDSQLREWQSRIPGSLGDLNTMTIANLFTEIYLLTGPIFQTRSTAKLGDSDVGQPIPASRLQKCLTLIRSFFDFILTLDKAAFISFASVDWGRFIQTTIIAIRLSFPLPQCPEWDHARAREQLQFESYLSRLSTNHEELTPSAKNMDTLSASKVVFGVIKRKYEARVANAEVPVNKLSKDVRGCPMIDGSLEQYFPVWDQSLNRTGPHGLVPTMPTGATTMVNGQPVYHDLWATMTMSWPDGPVGDPSQGQNGFDMGQGSDSLQLDPSFQATLGPSPTGSG